ncbi:MAG: hypothetical protein A2W52_03640 [Candidatus Taylorbacteria bacterium RIFCSPHIGHO2_02_49_25]|uniref:Damage-inducible protein J n=1 Tax=Candidatus Taylorbacteria bacterium RIFCSPHIGHO2_02_49_25 TaxID=1802305 RepID=A0A1G2MGY9_9BACT|nr:MAG: hypothetical protein UY62_C0072G0005 [Parcubacteria group bacterium GW2011_GWF2_50_9]OHA20052.1 MAG: hypothetical protein A2759_01125 [Candidatus Taylorbacteria bacterium RIFCSPHIGHO2_01_FULL_49_60]OHA22974.1 MAG: hypothetical protein A2W52_03640 [Candidatus Taylorbacteria bacterium RIFCSPHIGHO2_02_49_25]OHA35973.1 MAG: hypothetical protein A3B27_02120 [Candidatus Taylorbacteria bacterium RIFCSPLOWO2_01_FULL_50_130]OHA37355.1 MAG: hypothetical protein A2W65_00445 [Candidatus Taylorbacte
MKTVLNVKVDPKVKKAAKAAALELGLPLSLVVNESLKRFALQKAITFSAPLKPNKKLARWIKAAERDLKAGRNISPVFSNVEKGIEWLHS